MIDEFTKIVPLVAWIVKFSSDALWHQSIHSRSDVARAAYVEGVYVTETVRSLCAKSISPVVAEERLNVSGTNRSEVPKTVFAMKDLLSFIIPHSYQCSQK